MILPAVRDQVLLADLSERKRTWLVEYARWTPHWQAHRKARDELRACVAEASERARLAREPAAPAASPSPGAGPEDRALAPAATDEAERAARTMQRVARRRIARRFWRAHRPAPLPFRPRFRALLPEERVRALLITADLYSRMGGKVPTRAAPQTRTEDGGADSAEQEPGAAADDTAPAVQDSAKDGAAMHADSAALRDAAQPAAAPSRPTQPPVQ